jgi:ubiquinone/menaquinone biosynthesis C-methylase UbiE
VKSPIVSDKVKKAITEDMESFCRATKTEIRGFLPLVLNTARYDKMFTELRSHVGDLKGKRLLEVGCGYGMMLIHGLFNYALDIYGIEPTPKKFDGRYEIAQILLAENGIAPDRIVPGVGEHMPFEKATFDIVYSFQVLEHVQDPCQVLNESWRVLKPGGWLYCNAPNYRTFFEGHYNIPWIPGLPKWLARSYVKLWNRDPSLLAHLNFLNEPALRQCLQQVTNMSVQSDFGMADWLNRMRSLTVNSYTNSNIVRLVNLGKRFGVIGLIAALGKRIRWQDTLRVAIQKPLLNLNSEVQLASTIK